MTRGSRMGARMPSRAVIGVAVAALVLSLGPFAGAQEGDLSEFARPRRMVYLYEIEPGSLSPFDSFLLYNGILTSVSAANPDVVMVESPDLDVPATKVGKEELARRDEIGGDAWLYVYVAGDLSDLTVRAEIYDMLLQEVVSEQVIQPGFPVSYRTLARGFWDPIAETIAEGFEPVIDSTAVTLQGVAGTTVSGLPGGSLTIPESGVLTTALPNPATYSARAELSGHVPTTLRFYVGFQPFTLDIVQQATPQFALDAWASSFQFPGTRFWYYVTPAEWFVRALFTTQLVGINLVPNRPLLSSAPLSTVGVDGGIMFGSEESPTRLYGAAGLLLRVTHAPALVGLDTDGAPGGAYLSVGVEIAPWRGTRLLQQLSLIVDYMPTFYFADSIEEFADVSFSWNAFPDGRVPGFASFGWGVFDLRNLLIGAKFSW